MSCIPQVEEELRELRKGVCETARETSASTPHHNPTNSYLGPVHPQPHHPRFPDLPLARHALDTVHAVSLVSGVVCLELSTCRGTGRGRPENADRTSPLLFFTLRPSASQSIAANPRLHPFAQSLPRESGVGDCTYSHRLGHRSGAVSPLPSRRIAFPLPIVVIILHRTRTHSP